jgi:hypothetical protein
MKAKKIFPWIIITMISLSSIFLGFIMMFVLFLVGMRIPYEEYGKSNIPGSIKTELKEGKYSLLLEYKAPMCGDSFDESEYRDIEIKNDLKCEIVNTDNGSIIQSNSIHEIPKGGRFAGNQAVYLWHKNVFDFTISTPGKYEIKANYGNPNWPDGSPIKPEATKLLLQKEVEYEDTQQILIIAGYCCPFIGIFIAIVIPVTYLIIIIIKRTKIRKRDILSN